MLSIISERNKNIENNTNKKIFACIDDGASFIFNAGAGSGKTYSLVESLKYLISKKGEFLKYHNHNVICITFTNVAAEEIKQRLGNSSLAIVSTIHDRMWDIIQHHQPQLVEIHFNKLKNEIAIIEDEISNDGKFVNYQTLSEDKKKVFFEIMFDNKNLFYGVYNKPAVEIRVSFSEKLRDYPSLLRNIENFKKITTSLFKLDNYKKCVVAIKQKQRRYDTVTYDARYNNDALHKMRISHDTLLEYAREIVLKYDALKQIIIDKYPYVFVDEYQDTNPYVIDILSSLVEYSKEINHPFCVGYLGDSAQNIYDDGIGDEIQAQLNGFVVINKNFNRRSAKEIITIANRIRNDEIKQRSIFSDSAGGSIKFYQGTLENTDAFMQKYKEQWGINNNNKLHCFLLTNSTVAEYSGFGVFYSAFKEADIYKGGNYDALNTELLSDDIKKLGNAQLIYYKIIDIHSKLRDPQTQIAEFLPIELKQKMNLGDLRAFISNLNQATGSTFVEYLNSLINIANQDVSGHCTTFLKSVLDVDNLSLTDVKQKIAGILFPNGTESQEAAEKLEVILNLEVSICESWHRFIRRETNGDVVYHTYHGTKGLEFDNVIIIMGNAFGRERNYFKFYFSHYQCQNSLNDEEKEKMTKVKNLLYVSLTRAIKNLRILYVDETTNFNQGIKNLFGEIHSISM
ncbi:ATP-dependent helicase [Agathobaculum sp. NTUH-O15-33]|uniref:ATP-dependent helicase n=1 Tax=Agathobaculum sp. NTUH-O15-33 TaxID=3079302 RepID=UPI00295861D1|nr:ATP-dependent helicase [Agathobaculum sp. NTUH-O15-33]WNX86502.1 ATP-dependent helicase [Agathobaculum sp. NTUH-O15-33]